jgi:hypothetical protein
MSQKLIKAGTLVFLVLFSFKVNAQFLMDLPDTSEIIKLSGYIQPQFQVTQTKGAKSYNGGDFPDHVNNRFMIRRGRIRFDYVHNNLLKKNPSFQFALQLDGTERGVFIRDLWGRIFENKWQLFSLTTGMFARPFGFEVNLSSSDRESPERGRMSQILMKTERDLGVMGSIHPKNAGPLLRLLQIDLGLFNGQGLNAFSDFDSYKDFISRASLKPLKFGNFYVSGGLSYFNGGFLQNSRYINTTNSNTNTTRVSIDSSAANLGAKAPRKYKGADLQLKWVLGKNITEIRGEYWQGTQTALGETSETPGSLPNQPYYIRQFNGGFFYLLQRIKRHQVVIKYDFYDPNTQTERIAVRSEGRFSPADIRYNNIGFGYINYFHKNLKLMLWYDIVKNEKTSIAGYEQDLDDDVFTCRLQFRF